LQGPFTGIGCATRAARLRDGARGGEAFGARAGVGLGQSGGAALSPRDARPFWRIAKGVDAGAPPEAVRFKLRAAPNEKERPAK
jgi:hypothetical protein